VIMQTILKCQVHADIVGEYLLRLGNGQAWQLTSTVGAKSDVVELARIMGLRTGKSNGYPRLIFIRERREQTECEETPYRPSKNIEEDLRQSGWQAYDLRVLRVWYHDDTADLICEMRHDEGVYEETILSMRLSLYPIYQQVLDSEGLPLHAGLVENRGRGVLLAAPRNMGKSTSCRRLPSSWHSLCDEEALIVRDVERRYLVHPLPTWSDYFDKRSKRTWRVNNYLPLTSIFLLEKSTMDEVIPLGQGEATAFVNQLALQMCYRYWADLDPTDMRSSRTKLLENICELARAVPAFKLRVSLNGRFWERIQEVLP
jgi:SynChlorMet cassette protein ScmC